MLAQNTKCSEDEGHQSPPIVPELGGRRVRGVGIQNRKNFSCYATKMGEFQKIQIGVQLFDRSTNIFLNKIWIELDGILGIDHSCSRWWRELGRYGEKLRRKTVKSCCFTI